MQLFLKKQPCQTENFFRINSFEFILIGLNITTLFLSKLSYFKNLKQYLNSFIFLNNFSNLNLIFYFLY
ncbi:hypothetical protein ER70_08090 (plasmid) [Borreliella bissettiae]|uniref:Uncharacterized protein n=1 Tax=Borrelia bissettiae TaxID=64897 RepID=A0A1L8Z9Z6_BORBI|nr:hypothetical protein ER70_08090 [Borreliella bissettiae]